MFLYGLAFFVTLDNMYYLNYADIIPLQVTYFC